MEPWLLCFSTREEGTEWYASLGDKYQRVGQEGKLNHISHCLLVHIYIYEWLLEWHREIIATSSGYLPACCMHAFSRPRKIARRTVEKEILFKVRGNTHIHRQNPSRSRDLRQRAADSTRVYMLADTCSGDFHYIVYRSATIFRRRFASPDHVARLNSTQPRDSITTLNRLPN